ncbi:MAG: YhfC family intramembrane metalloprotease [Clostridia bacterium]|nr:YhfC family intramembrane metalloprotease [Clostridia bacterium]NLS84511.1 YhfC family intramembrane metalloprotease [Oscillospiraceae bacterium]
MNPLVITALIFDILIAAVLPIAALIILKKRTGRGLLAALVGVSCFMLFAMFLEQLLHAVVIPMIGNNAILYGVYGCLAAGIFEETGRLVGFSVLCKKDKSLATGVGYGIGHGGGEALLLVGISFIITLVTYFSGDAVLLSQLNDLATSNPFGLFAAGIERLSAMALQMALSILMWMVVTKRVPFYFYIVSILLHALLDVPAVVYQTTGGSLVVIEAAIALLAVLSCLLVKYIYDKSKPAEKETDADAGQATTV